MKICSSLLRHVSSVSCPARPAPSLLTNSSQRTSSARGGVAKIKGHQSVRYTGKLELSGDFTAEFVLVRQIARPNQVRSDATLQGLTMVRAWDGQEGWESRPCSAARIRGACLRTKAGIDRDCRHRRSARGQCQQGLPCQYLGTEDVDGTEAHKLKLTAKDGDVQYVYLDPDYFLVIRVLYQRSVRGAQVEVETDLGNYEVDGVYFPFSIDAGPKGGARTRRSPSKGWMPTSAEGRDFPVSGWRQMSAGLHVGVVLLFAGLFVGRSAVAVDAMVPMDSAAVSGIGIRNIGSATMSGRIAAVGGATSAGRQGDAVRRLGKRRRLAARSTAARRSSPCSTSSRCSRSARSRIDPVATRTPSWVGTGEAWTRNSVSIGNGIYKSTDGGDTWTNVGLPRIRAHRQDHRASERTATSSTRACPGKLWSDSRRARPVQDDRRRQDLDAGSQGRRTCRRAARRRPWTRRTPSVSSPACGTSGARAGRSAPAATARRREWQRPASGHRRRRRDRGRSSTPRRPRDCRPSRGAAVAVAIAPSNPKCVYALIESHASALFRLRRRRQDAGSSATAAR